MLKIGGVLRDYAWGAQDGLSAWHERTGGPQAELWYGAHPLAPSPIISDDAAEGSRCLDEVLAEEQAPVLVKILAVAEPLSLQVHPDAEHARAADADHTADRNEKNEMLVALTDFQALAGWRDAASAARLLERVGAPPEAIQAVTDGTPGIAVRRLLSMESSAVPAMVASIPDAVACTGAPSGEVQAYDTIARRYPEDAGALVALLLSYVELKPANALYVPAGVVHCYLSGTAVEVMVSSDNVYRLGMTPKPVWVDGAIDALRLDRRPALLVDTHVYELPEAPFWVELLDAGQTRSLPPSSYRLALALNDITTCAEGPTHEELTPGCAAVFPADDQLVNVTTAGTAVVVRAAA